MKRLFMKGENCYRRVVWYSTLFYGASCLRFLYPLLFALTIMNIIVLRFHFMQTIAFQLMILFLIGLILPRLFRKNFRGIAYDKKVWSILLFILCLGRLNFTMNTLPVYLISGLVAYLAYLLLNSYSSLYAEKLAQDIYSNIQLNQETQMFEKLAVIPREFQSLLQINSIVVVVVENQNVIQTEIECIPTKAKIHQTQNLERKTVQQ